MPVVIWKSVAFTIPRAEVLEDEPFAQCTVRLL